MNDFDLERMRKAVDAPSKEVPQNLNDKELDTFILDFAMWGGDSSYNKHPKCKSYRYWTDCGYEYDCGYPTDLACDDCKYGSGRKNPEAKCNTVEE